MTNDIKKNLNNQNPNERRNEKQGQSQGDCSKGNCKKEGSSSSSNQHHEKKSSSEQGKFDKSEHSNSDDGLDKDYE